MTCANPGAKQGSQDDHRARAGLLLLDEGHAADLAERARLHLFVVRISTYFHGMYIYTT